MKKLLMAVVVGTVLFFSGCSRGTNELGSRVNGAEIAVFLAQNPDWSASGPVVDENYRLASVEWVKSNISTYSFGDCDDWAGDAWRHAQTFGRVAFGMVINTRLEDDNRFGGHAFNFFIDENWTIWFFEPQTKKIWQPSKEELWYLTRHWI